MVSKSLFNLITLLNKAKNNHAIGIQLNNYIRLNTPDVKKFLNDNKSIYIKHGDRLYFKGEYY